MARGGGNKHGAMEKAMESEMGAKIISKVLDGKVYRMVKPNGKEFYAVTMYRSAKHGSPLQKAHFAKKMKAMMQLGKDGKLRKSLTPRNGNAQANYRAKMQRAIDNMSDPVKKQKAQNAFDRMEADHIHELQANGLDVQSNLWMLEAGINKSVGPRLARRLDHVPDGAPFQIFVSGW